MMRHALAVAIGSCILAAPAAAQSVQPFSIELALAGTKILDSDHFLEWGGEAQLRYSPGRFSVGVGGSYAAMRAVSAGQVVWNEAAPTVDEIQGWPVHSIGGDPYFGMECPSPSQAQVAFGEYVNATCSVTLMTIFVEPRIVIELGSDVIASYFSFRAGAVRVSAELSAEEEFEQIVHDVDPDTGMPLSFNIRAGPEYHGAGTGTSAQGGLGYGFLLSLGALTLDVGAHMTFVFRPGESVEDPIFGQWSRETNEPLVGLRAGVAFGIG